jgi:serine protease Do
MKMKRGMTTLGAALALGIGIGCGQALVGGAPAPWISAQVAPMAAEEATVIAVTRQATPAVVGIQRQGGSGSGVIIRSDGVLITNAHVVGNAQQVRVSLTDGSEFVGSVLGRDTDIDIAVVRITGQDFPAAPLADSDLLEVGQSAIAIGNPLGFERTVTRGIVSGLNRALGPTLDELIQTDAAINPGNSGGPLLNSAGQVIGINTAVIRPGLATGLGFAVPINLAADIAEQLLTTGVIRRAYLGIANQSVTPEMAQQLRLPVRQGIVVVEVGPGTPAAAAGLRRGDIITSIDDTPMTDGGDLRRFLRQRTPGATIRITGIRGQQQFTTNARLGEVRR